MISQTISHYRIAEKIGEGGMGVVYRAEDTKLERTVALKFLAGHLLNDSEAKQRFLREAKAAAALSHPNICTVHEIDEAEGKTFLAMEFVKGDTLEDRIAKGPLPLKQALDIGRQVAEGLEAAHRQGIVHRDIKPANILVSPEGRATIMDFGLARLTEASRLTKVDTAMGTVAYMSPEQAQGMDVDHRTDVWALGCVLYEMVSGQRPFQGQYDQALLYEIVHEEPAALTGLRTGMPIELELLVSKCLAKDREDRYQSAKETAVDLRTLAEKLKSGRSTILQASQMTGAVPARFGKTLNPVVAEQSPGSLRKWQALAAGLAVAFAGLLAMHVLETPPEVPAQPTRRFSFAPSGLTAAGISPDGRYIAFTAEADGESSLWLRTVGSESARQIPGTEGALPTAIAWSPDSQSIAFATISQLKRAAIARGDAVALANIPRPGFQAVKGATWSPDGERIVVSLGGGSLYEIPARGGELRRVLGQLGAGFVEPHFLPLGSGPPALLYESGLQLWVWNIATNETVEIGPGSAPVYSDGFLIHGSGDAAASGLFARPFSLETLTASGEDFPIAAGGHYASVAQDGTMVFVDGAGSSLQSLAWFSRGGELLQRVGQPQPNITYVSLSPDGERSAVMSDESGSLDIWIQDLVRYTKTRLTFDPGREIAPAWSPSGHEVAYARDDGEKTSLMTVEADGAAEAVVLVDSTPSANLLDWSPDGRYLAYDIFLPETQRDIVYLEFGSGGGVREPVSIVSTATRDGAPDISLDGRFVVFHSDESGRFEIYARPFPSGSGRWQASVNGGRSPLWSRDGSELYYVNGTTLMMVPVSIGEVPVFGRPQALFEHLGIGTSGGRAPYAVSADGQRFLLTVPVERSEDAPPPKIRIVENWYEEFRDREQD